MDPTSRNSAIYYDRINTDSCTVLQSNVKVTANGSIFPNTIAIDENGLFFSDTPVGSAVTIELKSGELVNERPYAIEHGLFTLEGTTTSNFVGSVSVGSNRYYVCTNSDLYLVDLNIPVISKLDAFQGFIGGDLEFINGFIYAHSVDISPTGLSNTIILKIDTSEGLVLDSFPTITPMSLDLVALPGLASQWKIDCSEKKLIIPMTYRNASNGDFIPIFSGSMDVGTNEGTFELNCQTAPPSLVYYGGFDAGSWETHRQVCEVRLDLDENDDQGRVGPHYRSIATCVTLFPVADNDVNIWTIDDRSIDSLVVYIKDFGPGPLEQYLRFDANPNFTVASLNDTLLRVYPALDGLTYNEWGSFLKSVRLEVPEPQTEGIRTVETWLYAGGLRADAARSYVNVRPDLPTAGPDRPYYACRAAVVRKKDIIGDASPGGHFEPELYARNLPFPPGAMDTIFQSDLIPYGTYRYIVEREGCRSDTALIDIQPPAELIAANPERNDTAFLCAGSSYNWAPGAVPTVIAGFYTDIGTTTDEPRTLTQPGTYTAYVDYFWPDNLILSGCGDIITLTLLPTPDSSLTNSLDTVLCAGQSLLYGGTVFSEAGSYNFTVDGEGCPVHYSLQIAYTDSPAVASDTTICAGESVSFGGTVYAATGSYSYTATADQGCDTTYTLNLTVSPPDLIVVDTTICGSNSFELAGNVFTATGSYTLQSRPGHLWYYLPIGSDASGRP